MFHPHDDNVHGLHDAGPYFPAPWVKFCLLVSIIHEFFIVFTLKFEFAIKNRGGGGNNATGNAVFARKHYNL
jgi:hypothetical protein